MERVSTKARQIRVHRDTALDDAKQTPILHRDDNGRAVREEAKPGGSVPTAARPRCGPRGPLGGVSAG